MIKDRTAVFIIKEIDSETFDVSFKNKNLIRVNHDDHGWQGIEDIISLVKEIGKVLKIPVVER